MKTILIVGKNGQIGFELQSALATHGHIAAVDRSGCDLSDPRSIINCIDRVNPDLIVNAAAYTAVDKAENDRDAAAAINTAAPELLATLAKKREIPLVHYSTDYVFDGTSSKPYAESDIPHPLNVYGRTKWEGEQAIAAAGGQYLILRTSWVYSCRGHNFFQTMLKLAAEKDELKIVNDQIGTPNWARTIAEATALLIPKLNTHTGGTFHLSSQGETSWFGFAEAIFNAVQPPSIPRLIPITTNEYPTAAKRPLHSTLDSSKLYNTFGVRLPDWQECLKQMVCEGTS